jgi:hypothetical protein
MILIENFEVQELRSLEIEGGVSFGQIKLSGQI